MDIIIYSFEGANKSGSDTLALTLVQRQHIPHNHVHGHTQLTSFGVLQKTLCSRQC